MPPRYPPYQTCHRRFQQWVEDGTFPTVLSALREDLRKRGRVNDIEAFVDGTYVGAKRGGACVGRCRAGQATKVMALADGAGLPLAVSIADGSRHDCVLVDQVLDEAFVQELPPNLIGDKAFDSGPLAQRLRDERNIELIAPRRIVRGGRRKQDGRRLRRYKRRWKVERLFAWLKRFRRLSTRWERKALNFLGLLELGCIVILLRQC